MRLIFLTNFLTPHQLPLARNFYKIYGKDYLLIETVSPDKKNIPIGWKQEGSFDFVVTQEQFYSDLKYYSDLINNCEVVFYGSISEVLIKERLKLNKLTFRYCERVYKKPCPAYQLPFRAIKYYWQFGRYKNLYLLCASAYTSGDYAKTGTFLNKAFKWGYFPETIRYDNIDQMISQKEECSILWAARMIDWKHPEIAVEMARRLNKDGYNFKLNIIGTGDMEEEIQDSIKKLQLEKCVNILGSMPPEDVRRYMEKSQIFLMTSDRQEGWGAVLNEAMNSGCAVVANSATGSAPYLISDSENGFLYNENDIEDMYRKIRLLLDDIEMCKKIEKNAYYTILEQWNSENAAQRLISLSSSLLKGNSDTELFKDGVCSCAKPILDNWYKSKEGGLV